MTYSTPPPGPLRPLPQHAAARRHRHGPARPGNRRAVARPHRRCHGAGHRMVGQPQPALDLGGQRHQLGGVRALRRCRPLAQRLQPSRGGGPRRSPYVYQHAWAPAAITLLALSAATWTALSGSQHGKPSSTALEPMQVSAATD
jgi:hypothetical protein